MQHESQSAAAWRCDGALGASLGFGVTSTMLGQSVKGIGAPVWDGAKRRPGRFGWLRRARHPTAAASPALFLFPIFIGEERGADSNSVQEWRAHGGRLPWSGS